MLGASDEGSRILSLAYRAIKVMFAELKAAVEGNTPRRKPASAGMAEGRSGAAEMPSVQPVPREVERGPP